MHFSEELQFLSQLQNHVTKNSGAVRKNKLVAPSLCINLNMFFDDLGINRLFTSLAK